MEELSPKRKGDVSELRVLAKLVEMGVDVYTPFGENTPVDVIVDDGVELYRLQVKTCRIPPGTNGSVSFNCQSTHVNCSGTERKGYGEKIDGFVPYWRREDEAYYVPIEDTPKSEMYLRFEESNNNQRKGTNYTENFKLEEAFN